MTAPDGHLTEGERQMLADGTLSADGGGAIAAHARECAACGGDVARLRTLVMLARAANESPDVPDDLWDPIRARIEQRKLVSMRGDGDPRGDSKPRSDDRRARRQRRLVVGLGALAAAAAIVAIVVARKDQPPSPDRVVHGADTARSLTAVVDSTQAYEAEAQQLLDRLELQRALIRPEAAQALDADLQSIDAAIAELKDAIARDPHNRALRQLLASSYRQKVELLKRAENAG
ncbi:MAG: hypothetical protein ACJ79K_02595 [Gemmatimonadaceae bacterium]